MSDHGDVTTNTLISPSLASIVLYECAFLSKCLSQFIRVSLREVKQDLNLGITVVGLSVPDIRFGATRAMFHVNTRHFHTDTGSILAPDY